MAWSRNALPVRPGVYTNFVDEAIRAIQGGERGTVAIPLRNYEGTAEPKKFYIVERMSEANELFGVDNVHSIRLAFMGGARNVLVYTLPDEPVQSDYDEMFEGFETYNFTVFVLGQDDDTLHSSLKTWVAKCRDEDEKHFMVVVGGSAEDDADYEQGNTRSNLLKDDYIVNLIVGVEQGGVTLSSAEFSPYIAGLIAGTPINQTITYKQVFADDVSNRLSHSQIVKAIEAGSLVLVNDGDIVKVEKGITTTGEHIRSIATRQTILNDVPTFLRNNVVAQIDNTEDGRASVVAMIKRYLDGLVSMNAITDPDVYVDPDNPPEQDSAFFVIEYTDVYSMERIFLTVRRQG